MYRILSNRRPKRIEQRLSASGDQVRCGVCEAWTDLRLQASVRIGSATMTVNRPGWDVTRSQWLTDVAVNVTRPILQTVYVCRECFGRSGNRAKVQQLGNHRAAPSVTVGQVKRELAEATDVARASQANTASKAWRALHGTPGAGTVKIGQTAFESSTEIGRRPDKTLRESEPETCLVCGGPAHTARCGRP